MKKEGYEKNEICNRDGCTGVIKENDIDGGCSCHIHPPCGYCTEPRNYCDKCEWDEKEELDGQSWVISDEQKKYYEDKRKRWDNQEREFYEMFSGKLEADKLYIERKSHSSCSMKIIGVHPKGFDLSAEFHRIRGAFGGRFIEKSDTRFVYIAYTD